MDFDAVVSEMSERVGGKAAPPDPGRRGGPRHGQPHRAAPRSGVARPAHLGGHRGPRRHRVRGERGVPGHRRRPGAPGPRAGGAARAPSADRRAGRGPRRARSALAAWRYPNRGTPRNHPPPWAATPRRPAPLVAKPRSRTWSTRLTTRRPPTGSAAAASASAAPNSSSRPRAATRSSPGSGAPACASPAPRRRS
jgi:hypothetical protein